MSELLLEIGIMIYQSIVKEHFRCVTKRLLTKMKFGKVSLLHKLILTCIHSKFFITYICMLMQHHNVTFSNCRNLLLSTIFGENFVKTTFLLTKLLNSWFDEIFFSERSVRVEKYYKTRSRSKISVVKPTLYL